MKLYKFRSLGTCDDLLRLEDILNTGKFWFSSLWEQNDSLEGVYLSDMSGDNGIFSEKNKFKICSFSSEAALSEPLMWAHYANGFKGVAIEIEAAILGDFHKVEYEDKLVSNGAGIATTKEISAKVLEIVTHKTENWRYESEHRCLKKMEFPGEVSVGPITGIYFGVPFKGVSNRAEILGACKKLQTHQRLAQSLKVGAAKRGLKCYEAHIASGDRDVPKVIIVPSPTDGQSDKLDIL